VPLALRESIHLNDLLGFNAHSAQRWTVGHGRDDNGSVVLEADKTPIEQMIDARGQQ
jgi:hypothetical protein